MQEVEKRLKNLLGRHFLLGRKIHQKLLKRYDCCFVRSLSYRLFRPERIYQKDLTTSSLSAYMPSPSAATGLLSGIGYWDKWTFGLIKYSQHFSAFPSNGLC